jgi:glycosyltransferase involved in cell wall biosynthesis
MSVLVSVVVPTYRRPQLLDRCLQALLAQSFDPWRYEIIVADDADDPDTKEQVMSWRRRIHGPTQILYAPVWDAHGPAAARNVGWRLAAGKVIAFTDDDTIPRRDWLARGMAAMSEDTAAAAGRVHVPLPPGRPSDYELDASHLSACEFVTANCFVRRDVLVAIGGFDERFTAAWREDSDLLFSLLEAHGKVVAAPSAVVMHPVRPAAWGVSLKQQRKILFDALLYKKHAALYRGRIRRAPRWDYYAIVLALGVALIAWAAEWNGVAIVAGAIWFGGTAAFCWRRLRGTSHSPAHVLEMIATSILIPPLAVFWRLVGAMRFGAFVA